MELFNQHFIDQVIASPYLTALLTCAITFVTIFLIPYKLGSFVEKRKMRRSSKKIKEQSLRLKWSARKKIKENIMKQEIKELELILKEISKQWDYSNAGILHNHFLIKFGDTKNIHNTHNMLESNIKIKSANRYLYFLLGNILKYKKGEISKKELIGFIDKF